MYAPDYHTTLDIKAKRITDEIPLEKLKGVPVAMFVGIDDTLADPADAEWAHEKMGDDTVIEYKLIEGGHLSFFIGKDMSYFSNDVLGLLDKYHHPVGNSEASFFLQ